MGIRAGAGPIEDGIDLPQGGYGGANKYPGEFMTIAPPVPDQPEKPAAPDLPDPAFPEVLPGGDPRPGTSPEPETQPETQPEPVG